MTYKKLGDHIFMSAWDNLGFCLCSVLIINSISFISQKYPVWTTNDMVTITILIYISLT